MLFQPVAHDLRQVMSLMKVSQNLERVSDEASNIAKRARKLLKSEELPEVRLLEESFELAISAKKTPINAFLDGDAKTAMEIIPRDKAVNKQR
ncbi:MAG: PhoU domain-containing protein [Verrucomicrobiales bacterium]